MALKITSNDIDHLSWIFSRMKSVHGESENLDYMHLFRQIIDNLRSDYSCVDSKVETPEEKEALDLLGRKSGMVVDYLPVRSIFEVSKEEFNNGNYGKLSADRVFHEIYSERLVLSNLESGKLFKKTKRSVEWWEDIVGYAKSCPLVDMAHYDYGNKSMHIKGGMTREQWCDFARILLEQESE